MTTIYEWRWGVWEEGKRILRVCENQRRHLCKFSSPWPEKLEEHVLSHPITVYILSFIYVSRWHFQPLCQKMSIKQPFQILRRFAEHKPLGNCSDNEKLMFHTWSTSAPAIPIHLIRMVRMMTLVVGACNKVTWQSLAQPIVCSAMEYCSWWVGLDEFLHVSWTMILVINLYKYK